ncbi:MAG: hypothetical protein CMI31_15305 [Opitutae bacterium]|nr:hypothetical protein [Opitutae bacterium]
MSEPNSEQQLDEAEKRHLYEEKLFEAGQKKILKSQLQDPWASKPLLLRMGLGFICPERFFGSLPPRLSGVERRVALAPSP